MRTVPPRSRSKIPMRRLLDVSVEQLGHAELGGARLREVTGGRIPLHRLVIVGAKDRQRPADAARRAGLEVAISFACHAGVRREVLGREALAAVEGGAQVLDALAAREEVGLGEAPAGGVG